MLGDGGGWVWRAHQGSRAPCRQGLSPGSPVLVYKAAASPVPAMMAGAAGSHRGHGIGCFFP